MGRVKKGPWAPAVLHRIHKRTTFSRSGCVEWISRQYMCVNYLRATMERRKTSGFWCSHFFSFFVCLLHFLSVVHAAYAFEYVFVVFLVRPSGVHERGLDGRRIDAITRFGAKQGRLLFPFFFPRAGFKVHLAESECFLDGGASLKNKKGLRKCGESGGTGNVKAYSPRSDICGVE